MHWPHPLCAPYRSKLDIHIGFPHLHMSKLSLVTYLLQSSQNLKNNMINHWEIEHTQQNKENID